MRIIVATDKQTRRRYSLCCNTGRWWFAPLPNLLTAMLRKPEEKLRELKAQQVVTMFKDIRDATTVNLAGYELSIEEPLYSHKN